MTDGSYVTAMEVLVINRHPSAFAILSAKTVNPGCLLEHTRNQGGSHAQPSADASSTFI